ncbi:MAG: hypothetical protein IJ745_05790 [Bacteroidales bacterium]|nr:hypothetical protein [Bacteroidales bacterium]
MKPQHPIRGSLFLFLLLTFFLTACSDDDLGAPAFLHIDAIKLAPAATNPITLEDGFYSSDIVACYVAAHYPGERSLDTIGLFTLPFTVPIRHSGPIDELQIYPAVRQSGSASALPFYTFYNPIILSSNPSSPSDTLVTRPYDTLRLDTLTTTYNLSLSDILLFELFEPTSASLTFDSVGWEKHAPDEACSGTGYAFVHVADSIDNVPFSIRNTFYLNDPTRLLYLELDSRSDLPFEVYMEAAYTYGGVTGRERVMVVNPSDTWKHLYINLGRTWSWFGHPTSFRLVFAALNIDGIEGDIRIDNVKLLTTNISH